LAILATTHYIGAGDRRQIHKPGKRLPIGQ
jgi:hypothetical protein